MFFFFVFFSMQSKYHVVASQSILDYAHLKMKKAKYSLQGKGKGRENKYSATRGEFEPTTFYLINESRSITKN